MIYPGADRERILEWMEMGREGQEESGGYRTGQQWNWAKDRGRSSGRRGRAGVSAFRYGRRGQSE